MVLESLSMKLVAYSCLWVVEVMGMFSGWPDDCWVGGEEVSTFAVVRCDGCLMMETSFSTRRT